jgi:hypothetical protein
VTRTAEDPRSAEVDHVLDLIGADLRTGGTLVGACVREGDGDPALGRLVAAGPRAAGAPGAYARVIESVREGYLLHYGEPRLVRTDDRDLALLAGDYMYASGLALLASLGDLDAVRILAELISLCAHVHTESGSGAPALWLAGAVAIGAGDDAEHDAAKEELRAGEVSGARLWRWAASGAARAGLGEELGAAAETVGFATNERR